MPFVVRSVLPALRAISPNLRGAAQVLGASPMQVWRFVDLPLISRGLIVGATFAFTVSMGEFGATVFVARPDTPTMPVVIYRLLGQPGAANYGQALAMSTILMAVCAVIVRPDRARAHVGNRGILKCTRGIVRRGAICNAPTTQIACSRYEHHPPLCRPPRPARHRPRRCRRRDRLPARTERLRQDDPAAHRGRAWRPPTAVTCCSTAHRSRDQPVHTRDFGLMFQEFALFPHLNVHAERRVRLAHEGDGQAACASAAPAKSSIWSA